MGGTEQRDAAAAIVSGDEAQAAVSLAGDGIGQTVAERRAAARAAAAEAKAARVKAAAAKRRRDARAKVRAAAAKAQAATARAAAREAKAAAKRTTAVARVAVPATAMTPAVAVGGRGANTWTQRAKLAFFGELALSANVSRSAKVAGMGEASAYRKKRSDPAFAHSWGIALAEGYSRIELMLLERALASADEADGAGASGLSDRVMMTLYTQHRQSVREVREAATKQGGGEPPKATRARLEAKLARMHARLVAE